MRERCIQILIFMLLPVSLMAEITVTARFNPPRVAFGDRAQYLVEIRESDSRAQPQIERVTSLPIPNSGGLELKNGRTSTSQQTQILNGAAEYSVTQSLIIDASAPRVGTYTIPAFAFTYKGEQLTAPAATLTVVERSADAGPPRDELVFLRANLPTQLYVGQKVGFALKLYVSEEVQISSLNRFDRSADGYTISDLPESHEETVERVDGRRYRVLSWPMTLTPIQTGSQAIRFEIGMSARLPQQSGNRVNDPFGRSPFGRSIFDDFFGRNEQLNIYTDASAIEILPLPEAGKPDDFSGAIGDFAMEVSSDAEGGRQGEPVMLSVQLKGRGNFDRIDGPSFPDSDTWRVYDPEAKFEPSDSIGLRGSKRFDYVMVPQKSGELELPETTFSYFDPNDKKYITLTAPAIPIQIAEAPARVAPPMTATTTTEDNQQQLALSRNLTNEEALLTLDYQPKAPAPLGIDLIRKPVFITINVLTALSLSVACVLIHRSRKHRDDPHYRLKVESKAAAKAATASARQAAKKGDADRFFSDAAKALRLILTARTARNFQSASMDEIASAMAQLNAKEAQVTEAKAFLEAADAQRFGRRPTTSLQPLIAQFESILKEL